MAVLSRLHSLVQGTYMFAACLQSWYAMHECGHIRSSCMPLPHQHCQPTSRPHHPCYVPRGHVEVYFSSVVIAV